MHNQKGEKMRQGTVEPEIGHSGWAEKEARKTAEGEHGEAEWTHHGGFVQVGGPDGYTRRAETHEIAFQEISEKIDAVLKKLETLEKLIREPSLPPAIREGNIWGAP